MEDVRDEEREKERKEREGRKEREQTNKGEQKPKQDSTEKKELFAPPKVEQIWRETQSSAREKLPKFLELISLYLSDKSHKLQVLKALKDNFLLMIGQFKQLVFFYFKDTHLTISENEISDLTLFMEKIFKKK